MYLSACCACWPPNARSGRGRSKRPLVRASGQGCREGAQHCTVSSLWAQAWTEERGHAGRPKRVGQQSMAKLVLGSRLWAQPQLDRAQMSQHEVEQALPGSHVLPPRRDIGWYFSMSTTSLPLGERPAGRRRQATWLCSPRSTANSPPCRLTDCQQVHASAAASAVLFPLHPSPLRPPSPHPIITTSLSPSPARRPPHLPPHRAHASAALLRSQ